MLSKLLASTRHNSDSFDGTDTTEVSINMDSLSDSCENGEEDSTEVFNESTEEESVSNNKSDNMIPKKEIAATIKKIKSKQKEEISLFCHKNAKIPPVIIRIASKCFHVECCKCCNCMKQITSPSASVISENPFKIICNECSEQIEEETILCPICHQEVSEDDEQDKLLTDFICHSSCIHCFMCSRTKADKVSFAAYEANGKQFCLCKDCIDFITRGKVPDEDLSGRIPQEIVGKSMRCDSCRNEFSGRFFFMRSGRALCKSCATESDE